MHKKMRGSRVIAGLLVMVMLGGCTAEMESIKVKTGTEYKRINALPGEATLVTGLSLPGTVQLADENAVPSAAELFSYLKGVREAGYVLYGHQNDTHHKGGGTFEGSSSSDTKDLTGSIAAICGIDTLSFTGAELPVVDGKKDSAEEAAGVSIEAAAQGGIITLSAHMPNFSKVAEKGKDENGNYDYSGYSPDDTGGAVMEQLLPGGKLNQVYTGYLDLIAKYALLLQEKDIPVLFRPFHENNGSWFWWGAAYCDEDTYKNVFRYTEEYLMNEKGVHNFLYVYSPNGPFPDEADYESRYPGDEYVDVIAFDMYHDNPKQEDGFIESFRSTVKLVEQIAGKHGKIPAVSETGMRVMTSLGDGKNYGGLAPFGNPRLNWFQEIGKVAEESKMPYFMVWANFDGVDNFFAPYKTDAVHGHEMADGFIDFYNDKRTVFADGTNFYSKIETPSVVKKECSGYFLSPVSGSRMNGTGTVLASLSKDAEIVQFILENEDQTEVVKLKAEKGQDLGGLKHIYSASVSKEQLRKLGKSLGIIKLQADGKPLNRMKLLYNMEEEKQDPAVVDSFEHYLGNNELLAKNWAVNSAPGCSVSPIITKEYKAEGDYGMAFQYHISSMDGSEGWAGTTRQLEADWKEYQALQLFLTPDGKGQKLVIQLTSKGEDFEVFLPEFAATTESRYITIPFSAMKGKNGGTFDPSAITGFGMWCNTIGQTEVESVMYVDDIHGVRSDAAEVVFGTERQ